MAFAIGVYIVVLIALSLVLGKFETQNEYAIADRKVGAFGIFASTFTLIGAGEFLTVASLAFINQGAAIALLAGYGIGMVLLGLVSRFARKHSTERHYQSLPDYIYDQYGAFAGIASSLLTLLAFFALLVLQLFAGAIVLSEITPLSMIQGAAVCAIAAAVYLIFAGFRGVILTDKIQFSLMVIGLPLLAYISFSSASDFGKLLELDFAPLPTFLVLVTGVFVVVGSGDIWQRLYAAKSHGSARLGMVTAGIGFTAYGVILASIGIAAREYGLASDADSAFLSVVLANDTGVLSAAVVLAVFSAILSTADTEIFLISTLLENERRRWFLRERTHESDPKGAAIKVFIAIVAFLGILASIFAESLVAIYETLLYALLALSPLVLIGMFRAISARNATVVLLLGVVSLIALKLIPSATLSYAAFIVIPGFVWGLVTSRTGHAE